MFTFPKVYSSDEFILRDGIDSIQNFTTFDGVWPSTKNTSVFKREQCVGRSPSFRPSAILSLLLRPLRLTLLLFKYTEHTLFTFSAPHNDLVRKNDLRIGSDGLLPARN